MAPGWTSYHHRLQYQTYDITELLEKDNEITVTVGNGWYKGELGFDARPNLYGDRTALLAMVCIEYEDGETICIGTDTDWHEKFCFPRFITVRYRIIQKKEGRWERQFCLNIRMISGRLWRRNPSRSG